MESVLTLERRDAVATRHYIASSSNVGCGLALDPTPDVGRVGSITLHTYQSEAVGQLREMLLRHGGAVLADDVGLGKTYVALAIAREWTRVAVVCPAVLCEMWRGAAERAAVPITIDTTESLSRARDLGALVDRRTAIPAAAAGLLIVDEAHHFRNPGTRRFRVLAARTASTPVLLLTATPIHNRQRDVSTLLSLFLGSAAESLNADDFARFVLRRREARAELASGVNASTVRPRTVGPRPVSVGDDAETLDRLVALPPPLPPSDGHDCSALATFGLVRQWASSGGALKQALERRLAKALAIEASLERGAYPTYRDLRVWCFGEGSLQLAMPEVLMPASLIESPTSQSPGELDRLLCAVRSHADGLRGLLSHLDRSTDIDSLRAERLREIVLEHSGTRVVAFSALADTVTSLYRLLRYDGGVAALTGRGGTIASGPSGRGELLRQFASPGGSGLAAMRIDLLLTTDLLSEGLNLQAAGVVVHLDLPWTAARLEQRVGRLARLGSAHHVMYVYSFSPPARAARVLEIENRLRSKLALAGRAIGVSGRILPPTAEIGAAGSSGREDEGVSGAAEYGSAIRHRLNEWLGQGGVATGLTGSTVWTAVQSPVDGFVAACGWDGRMLIVASLGHAPTDAPAVVARALSLAQGEETAGDEVRCRKVLADVLRWASGRRAAAMAGLVAPAPTAGRLALLGRISSIVRRTPPHARPTVLPLADRARRVGGLTLGIGAEWQLEQISAADMPDRSWLESVVAFGALSVSHRKDAAGTGEPVRVPAILLLVGDRRCRMSRNSRIPSYDQQ